MFCAGTATVGYTSDFSFSDSEKGFVRMHRKADVRHEATRMPRRMTRVTVKPGVVMQMSPSSRAGKIIVSCVPLSGSAIWNVKSPDDTTRMTLLRPTCSSVCSVDRDLRTRRSSRFLTAFR